MEIKDVVDMLNGSLGKNKLTVAPFTGKCPICEQAGKTSIVHDHGGYSTLAAVVPFHDEEGRHHVHDNNTTTNNYTCSNGHDFSHESHGSCWCGWVGK